MTNYATGFTLRERLYGTEAAAKWIRKKIKEAPTYPVDKEPIKQSGRTEYTEEIDYDINAMYSMGFLNQEIADYLNISKSKIVNHIFQMVDSDYMKRVPSNVRKARHDKLLQMRNRGKYQDVKLIERVE